MKYLITLITIILMTNSSFGCDCDWGGDFFTMAKEADLVVKVKIHKKLKDGKDFNNRMKVEILETYKGKQTRNKIIIWGDDGNDCRPYVDYFVDNEIYYLSLFKFGKDYEQSNCGELYVKLEGCDKVVEEEGISDGLPQIGVMERIKFEERLKNELK